MPRRRPTGSRAATCSASSSGSTTSRTSASTALYLTPVFASASNHRYHTYDYLAVDPLLGGDDALRELLDAAHDRGMRVILDGVFNHTGRGFWPFHHVLENGAASPYRRWFHFDDGAARCRAAARRLPDAPGIAARPSSATQGWWDLPALPKLNTDEPAGPRVPVRRRRALAPLRDRRLAARRAGEIDDEAFWQEFRRRCRAIRPGRLPRRRDLAVAPDWLHGDRFDALMNYPLAEAILGFAGGSDLDIDVIARHREYRQRPPARRPGVRGAGADARAAYDRDVVAVQLNLLGSHDTPRLRTMLGGGTERRPARDAPSADAARARRASTTATRSG